MTILGCCESRGIIQHLSTSKNKDTNSNHPAPPTQYAYHRFPIPDAPLALGSTFAGDPRYGSFFLNPAFSIISVNVVSGRLKYASGGEYILMLSMLGSFLGNLLSGVLGDVTRLWPMASGCLVLDEREKNERTLELRCLDLDSRRRKSVRQALWAS